MRFLTPSIFLTLTSTLLVSALPTFSQFETRTDDLISRDGLEARAVAAKSQAMADKIEKDIMMEEWGHSKRAVAVSAKSQAMADKIEKDIMMEEWGHSKRSPKTQKLGAAALAQADAEEEEDEEENTKRSLAEEEDEMEKRALFDSVKKPAATSAPADNNVLAASLSAAIAEDEAPGLSQRSPKVKKLGAAALAQADAEEDEDEEDNTKRALLDFAGKKPAAATSDTAATGGDNNAIAASISAGLTQRSPKTKKLSAAEVAQADAEEDEDEEDN